MEKILQSFLAYLEKEKNYSSWTITAYGEDIAAFMRFLQETEGASWEVEYRDIRAWIVRLSELELNNRSINRKISALRSFYRFLLRIGEVKVDPLQLHRSLKVEKKIQIPFSVKEIDEVRAVLKQGEGFDSLRSLVVVEFLYSFGLRRSELRNLRVYDIDLNNLLLKVVGKGNKMRYIPIMVELTVLIKYYLAERGKMLKGRQDINFFLIDDKGGKVDEMFVYRIINTYFSNVTTKEKKSPHMLRHSFATHLLEGGADINSIKELMGHESLSSTEVYAQVNLKELKSMYMESHPRAKRKK
ncbi:MAG: tyrosine-type recombinase/integrase [Flavobacteriaceae bacterium]|jgi:integrase/recombinase XerC|nr:tyrosine-type recombinase/integrase [Flavobacteriaceae bacterium]